MKESLCKTCTHCMVVTVKNVPGGSGDRSKVVCLILPELFNTMDLVSGHYHETRPYPYTAKCNKWEAA